MYRMLSVAGLLYICFLGRAAAHEHHGEDIPEGQAVTAEPIVSGLDSNSFLGCADDGH